MSTKLSIETIRLQPRSNRAFGRFLNFLIQPGVVPRAFPNRNQVRSAPIQLLCTLSLKNVHRSRLFRVFSVDFQAIMDIFFVEYIP
jgi:hypothetical protein